MQVGRTRSTVLVVDDSAGDLDVLHNLLAPHYDVLAAPSGEHALRIAASTSKLDAVLLDVLMPDMDGYAVLARLRANPATREIPVILVTGLDSTEDEESGLEHGAVDYIAKPYRPPIILPRLRAHIELKQARDRLTDQNAYLEKELTRRLKEIQQAEVQLLQSEKLATVGQLAAGIVHEINSPITYFSLNLKSLGGYLLDIFALLDAYETLEGACPETETVSRIRNIKQERDIDYLRADIGQLMSECRQGVSRVAKIVSDL